MIIFFTKKFTVFKLLILFIFVSVCFNVFKKIEAKNVPAMSEGKGYIAVVIDDFGYNGEGTEEMLCLDMPLTAAILPFSENTSENMQSAIDNGKEVIIHLPMESKTGKISWLGETPILKNLSDEEIIKRFCSACEKLGCAQGFNNHMGSAVMEDERILNLIFEEASKKGLYFLDSKTTPNSAAKKIAEEKGVLFLERDVFLDSTDDVNVVKSRLKEAAEIALKKGYAIAIGHVGPEGGNITVKALKEMQPELEKLGIEFVTLSRLEEILKGENDGA